MRPSLEDQGYTIYSALVCLGYCFTLGTSKLFNNLQYQRLFGQSPASGQSFMLERGRPANGGRRRSRLLVLLRYSQVETVHAIMLTVGEGTSCWRQLVWRQGCFSTQTGPVQRALFNCWDVFILLCTMYSTIPLLA